MSDPLLQALYTERNKLIVRLNAINEFIEKLGGDVGDSSNIIVLPSTKSSLQTAPAMRIPTQYSPSLSWKEKIAYALNILGKPSTAKEISDYIKENEPDIKGLDMVTQYCSAMLKNGQLIAIGKVGKQYLYDLKRVALSL